MPNEIVYNIFKCQKNYIQMNFKNSPLLLYQSGKSLNMFSIPHFSFVGRMLNLNQFCGLFFTLFWFRIKKSDFS
jgi:hypothetical protein